MAGNYGFKYDIDLVMVIDATGSMDRCIMTIKENAKRLYRDFCKRLEEDTEKTRTIHQMRIRVITFRDFQEYLRDGRSPLDETKFYNMPEEEQEFYDAISSINAEGGGDFPEDGLEALAVAIRSEWTPKSQATKRRQIIVLWTDDGTHELGYGKAVDRYPKGMPKDFAELTRWWREMDAESKRLVLFSPTKEKWSSITRNWDKVVWLETQANQYAQVMEKITRSEEYGQILDLLVKTI